ncbi:MAG TPA: M1 family aminopeptidase, partial [Candidatus Sumerlaeota bacterium]|nr:M1 family aminopeptidase [Candidatus Sumerlaeota bacterium]
MNRMSTVSGRLIRCFLALVFILLVVCNMTAGEGIDLSNRHILFRAGAESAQSGPAVSRSADGLLQTVDFKIPRDVPLKGETYAVHILGAFEENFPEVFLNGGRIDYSPLRRSDGFMFHVPWGLLNPRIVNRFEFRFSADRAPVIEAVDAFSLLGTSEEVHFERVFSDIGVMAQPAAHPDQLRYDAQHYVLSLELIMTSTQISNASLTISGEVVNGPMSQVVLDFHPNGGLMTVSSVRDAANQVLTHSIDTTNRRLHITLPAPLATSETFTVTVYYSGTPATGGTFGAPYRAETHGSGAPVIYTFSQPYGARHWWPCKDIPEDKATMEMKITVPEPYFAVSNGSLVSLTGMGTGKRVFHYSETYPMVTYLASICCSDYAYVPGEYTSQDGLTFMPVGHYVYPENYEAEKNGLIGTLEAMNLFATMFDEYPFLTEKYVTATHNSGSGMEHQTCTSMPALNLSPDGRHRRNIHELAHMWFGDAVAINHFDHLWLNEGYATYAEALYDEHYYGKAAYHAYVNSWITTGIDDTRVLVSTSADAFRGSLVYRKGAMVLHMLRHVMGDESFFNMVRSYYKKHIHSTVLTPDLQAKAEEFYGGSLSWFFNRWVYAAGRPRYSWAWTLDKEGSDNLVRLSITQTHTGDAFQMPVDIVVSPLNGSSQTHVVFNNQKAQQDFVINTGSLEPFEVQFDPDNWILKNMTTSAAPAPILKSVMAGVSEDNIVISWESGGGVTGSFQIIGTDNLTTWTVIANSHQLPASASSFTIPDVRPDSYMQVRIRALSATGQAGPWSDTYDVRRAEGPRVLVVDGNDRWAADGLGPHAWAAWNGFSINECGVSFDSCANEAVIAGGVSLADYDAVIWVLG